MSLLGYVSVHNFLNYRIIFFQFILARLCTSYALVIFLFIPILLSQAWGLWTDKKVLDLMDENLQDTCIANQFVKCVNIGLLCVQENPGDRPTMMNVIKMFDIETVNLPTPKRAAFFIGRDQSKATSSDQPE